MPGSDYNGPTASAEAAFAAKREKCKADGNIDCVFA